MATSRRNDLINLLLETANDDDLRGIVDGFFAPAPKFPVEHAHLIIVAESGPDMEISWESTTTRLAEVGFAFGDVLTQRGKLYRAVARTSSGKIWVTSSITSDAINVFNPPSGLEKHDGEVASDASERLRLSEALRDGSGSIEDALGSLKSPRFPVEHRHLTFRSEIATVTFDWSSMTTDLSKETGCTFGDVLLHKGSGKLYRAVAHQDGKFWTTSDLASNRVGHFSSFSKDEFEKM